MRPYLRAANVGWHGLKLDDVKEMNFSAEEMSTYKLLPGDVILGEASGSPSEVGKPALWMGEIDDCAFQNTLLRVRSHSADPRFLLHWFRHLAASGAFAAQSRGVGIHHIGRAKLAAWEVPLPPPHEQRIIVDILEEQLSHLDVANRTLSVSATRATALESSVLAESYRVGGFTKLGDLAQIQGGIQKQPKRAPRQNAYPFLRVANVTAAGLDLRDVHQIELFSGELGRLALRPGDLLVVEGNGSPSQIGRAALWDGSIADCVHQNHLIRIRPTRDVSSEYLELLWNSPQNRRVLTDLSSSSSGLHTLSVSKLRALEVPLPSLEIQAAAVVRAGEVRRQRTALQRAIELGLARSAVLRQVLLSAAFAGRLSDDRSSADEAGGLARV